MEIDQLSDLMNAITPLLLGVIGYFLKDLHRSFQALSAQVSSLAAKITAIEAHHAGHGDKIETLRGRIERLEMRLDDHIKLTNQTNR